VRELGLTQREWAELFAYRALARFGYRALRVLGAAAVAVPGYALLYWVIGGSRRPAGRAARAARVRFQQRM